MWRQRFYPVKHPDFEVDHFEKCARVVRGPDPEGERTHDSNVGRKSLEGSHIEVNIDPLVANHPRLEQQPGHDVLFSDELLHGASGSRVAGLLVTCLHLGLGLPRKPHRIGPIQRRDKRVLHQHNQYP